jgi:hypothetical protein
MNKRLAFRVLVLVAVVAVSGCTFHRTRFNIEDFNAKAAKIEPGKTKVSEMVQILGTEPNTILPVEDGNSIYIYYFGDTKTGGLTLIVLNFLKTNAAVDSGFFVVDKNNVVQRAFISTNSEEVSWGWWPF